MIIKTKNAEFDSASVFTSMDVATKIEEIKEYLDNPVYLADSIGILKQRIEERDEFKLKDINEDIYSFTPFRQCNNSAYALCLPADAVKFIEKEIKYRPFKTGPEFVQVLGVDFGDVITWRYKNQKNQIYKEMITGIGTDDDGTLTLVCLADIYWTTEKLFEKMEYQDANGEWHVFGIKETEE